MQPDIKVLQIQLTGFLDKDTAKFCKELWTLCLSAQSNPQGVPKELLEAKKLELIQEKVFLTHGTHHDMGLLYGRLLLRRPPKKLNVAKNRSAKRIAILTVFVNESAANADEGVVEVIGAIMTTIGEHEDTRDLRPHGAVPHHLAPITGVLHQDVILIPTSQVAVVVVITDEMRTDGIGHLP